MSKVEGDLASSVVSTEVLPGDETDGLKISESLSSTTMEKTIRSLFNPNRKPQKRVVPPTNQLSHSKLQAPLSKKRVKRPSTSTIGSDVQPPAVKRAKQAKVSTSTIGGDLRAKQTKLQPIKLVNPKAIPKAMTNVSTGTSTVTETFLEELHSNTILRIFEEESFSYVPDRTNDDVWTNEVTLETGQFFLGINTIVDSWVRSRANAQAATGTSAVDANSYVIVTEDLMQEFELYKQDMLSKARPKPGEALLRSNEVVRKWIDEEQISPHIIHYRGEEYLLIPLDVVDCLCDWVKQARCRYPFQSIA